MRTTRLGKTVRILSVLTLALALLSYVGYEEAFKTYPVFQFDRAKSLGDVVRTPVEAFLNAGLPINQFPGFFSLTKPIVDSEERIAAIVAEDNRGGIIFSNSKIAGPVASSEFAPASGFTQGKGYLLRENKDYYHISTPLKSKFENVGRLSILYSKKGVRDDINNAFVLVLQVFTLILSVSGLIFFFAEHRWGRKAKFYLKLSYSGAFVTMSLVVMFTLITVYSNGILGKTEALANSLAARIKVAMDMGLDIKDFSDMTRIFNEYKKNNPDLGFTALGSEGVISIHTDPDMDAIGKKWKTDERYFEYSVPLKADLHTTHTIYAGILKKVVWLKLWRVAKNFTVLFVASAFMAALFFNLLSSSSASGDSADKGDFAEKLSLDLIKPVFFIAIFTEGLTVSFLPQYFQNLAVSSGLSADKSSLLFAAFFAAYALILIPAGRYAQTRDVKKLVIPGAIILSCAMFLTCLVKDFHLMLLVRLMAGAGQGAVFIGVQTYILNNVSARNKTSGAAIIVSGYYGGMISGSAIGGLLVTSVLPGGIFMAAGSVGLLLALYVSRALKADAGRGESSGPAGKSFFSGISRLAGDLNFIKTIVLVGITAKAVLTGVAIFAVPIILSGRGYAKEDIGQIFMFYAGGTLLTSNIVSKIVDKYGKTKSILCWGTLAGGIGLLLIGLIDHSKSLGIHFENIGTVLVISGMLILGLAHGFINAPVVTHVSNMPSAKIVGASTATSIYRFLERIGHVMGPWLMATLLAFYDNGSAAIILAGAVSMIFALIFAIGRSSLATGDERS